MLRTILLSLAVALLFAPHADACRCAPPPAPDKALEKSLGVFAGKVTAVETKGQKLIVTLSVSQSWKGKPAKEVTVKTASSSAACGVAFKKDGKYIIYATGENNGVWATNSCTRTKPLAGAKEDLEALGEGELPE